MTRDEMAKEIAAGMDEFRRARGVVEETQRRLEKVFSEAADEDQLWFAGRVMAALGELVDEAAGRVTERAPSGMFPPMVVH